MKIVKHGRRKLYAISGKQGCGKTKFLRDLKDKSENAMIVYHNELNGYFKPMLECIIRNGCELLLIDGDGATSEEISFYKALVTQSRIEISRKGLDPIICENPIKKIYYVEDESE